MPARIVAAASAGEQNLDILSVSCTVKKNARPAPRSPAEPHPSPDTNTVVLRQFQQTRRALLQILPVKLSKGKNCVQSSLPDLPEQRRFSRGIRAANIRSVAPANTRSPQNNVACHRDATAKTSSGCHAAGRWIETLIRGRMGFPEKPAVQRLGESQFGADRSREGWFPWKDQCQGPERDSVVRTPEVPRTATMSAESADA